MKLIKYFQLLALFSLLFIGCKKDETSLPVASLTADKVTGTYPLTVVFTNTSTGSDTQAWDFGDGSASNEKSPTHIFTAKGKYTVVLKVTNAGGTTSSEIQITVVDQTIKDGENNEYRIAKYGDKWWTIDNIRTTKTPAGAAVVSFSANNDANNDAAYGRLYTHGEAVKVCPTGWHIATSAEWTALFNLAGSQFSPAIVRGGDGGWATVGGLMKYPFLTYWNAPNSGGNNNMGFNAPGAGMYDPDGLYYGTQTGYLDFKGNAYYWSSDKNFADFGAGYSKAYLYDVTGAENIAASVRCVKD